MTSLTDATLLRLFGAILLLLVAASAIGGVLHQRVSGSDARATIDNLNARIRAWWVMALVFMASSLTGRAGSVLLFATISVLALREFVMLRPGTGADRRT